MAKNKKDIAEKMLLDHADVFADIFNVLVFDGEQVIHPENLVTDGSVSQLKIGKDIHMQERDVAKIWTDGHVRLSLLGLENQTAQDKDMVLRIMGYDGAAYKAQVVQHKSADSLRKKGQTDGDAKRLPSYPVVSLVLYFGNRRWSKATSLLDSMEVDIHPKLRSFISDYHINVVDVAWLDDDTVAKFQSDFRIVADYFVQTRKNKDYVPSQKTIDHVEEILSFLQAVLNDHRFTEVLEDINFQEDIKKGEMTMCKVLDKVEARGKAAGIAEGEAKGEAKGKAEGIAIGHENGIKAMVTALKKLSLSKADIAQNLVEGFGLSLKAAEQKTEFYWH